MGWRRAGQRTPRPTVGPPGNVQAGLLVRQRVDGAREGPNAHHQQRSGQDSQANDRSANAKSLHSFGPPRQRALAGIPGIGPVQTGGLSGVAAGWNTPQPATDTSAINSKRFMSGLARIGSSSPE